jgi:hypothetical protein
MTRQGTPKSDAANDDCFVPPLTSTRLARGPDSARRTAYARFLRKRELEAVEVRYRGRLGSGRCGYARALDADEDKYAIPTEFGLREWCARYFGKLLQMRYPHWKDGDGSAGMFMWYLRDDRLTHWHYPGSRIDSGVFHIES